LGEKFAEIWKNLQKFCPIFRKLRLTFPTKTTSTNSPPSRPETSLLAARPRRSASTLPPVPPAKLASIKAARRQDPFGQKTV